MLEQSWAIPHKEDPQNHRIVQPSCNEHALILDTLQAVR